MGTIWIIGVIVFGMRCAYRFGQLEFEYQREDAVVPMVLGVLFWPLVLAGLILLAPFAGMAALGKRSKKKDN